MYSLKTTLLGIYISHFISVYIIAPSHYKEKGFYAQTHLKNSLQQDFYKRWYTIVLLESERKYLKSRSQDIFPETSHRLGYFRVLQSWKQSSVLNRLEVPQTCGSASGGNEALHT